MMIVADPSEIETGEEAMIERIRDGLNRDALEGLLADGLTLSAFEVGDISMMAHGGEPVFKVDLMLRVESSLSVDLTLPPLYWDKEGLAFRSRCFWEGLKKGDGAL